MGWELVLVSVFTYKTLGSIGSRWAVGYADIMNVPLQLY